MAVLTAARRVLLAGDEGGSRGRCLQIRRLANPGGRARKTAHVRSADGSGSLLPQMSRLWVSRRITRALFPERRRNGGSARGYPAGLRVATARYGPSASGPT